MVIFAMWLRDFLNEMKYQPQIKVLKFYVAYKKPIIVYSIFPRTFWIWLTYWKMAESFQNDDFIFLYCGGKKVKSPLLVKLSYTITIMIPESRRCFINYYFTCIYLTKIHVWFEFDLNGFSGWSWPRTYRHVVKTTVQ